MRYTERPVQCKTRTPPPHYLLEKVLANGVKCPFQLPHFICRLDLCDGPRMCVCVNAYTHLPTRTHTYIYTHMLPPSLCFLPSLSPPSHKNHIIRKRNQKSVMYLFAPTYLGGHSHRAQITWTRETLARSAT